MNKKFYDWYLYETYFMILELHRTTLDRIKNEITKMTIQHNEHPIIQKKDTKE